MGSLMAAEGPARPYLEMPMIRSLSIFVLGVIAFLATALLVGCTYERSEAQADRRDSTDINNTDHKRSREERIRDAREDSADSSRVALAYPTGNRSTSAILVERMS